MRFPARCTACRVFPATGGLIAAIPRLTHRPSLKFPQLSPILDLMHKRRTRASFTPFNRTAHMTNPLLTPFSLPPFSAIKPEHVVPAVTKALEDCRAAVESAVAHGAPYSWENLLPAAGGSGRCAGTHLLACQPSQFGKKQPGTARGLRTDAAAALRVQHLGRPA